MMESKIAGEVIPATNSDGITGVMIIEVVQLYDMNGTPAHSEFRMKCTHLGDGLLCYHCATKFLRRMVNLLRGGKEI